MTWPSRCGHNALAKLRGEREQRAVDLERVEVAVVAHVHRAERPPGVRAAPRPRARARVVRVHARARAGAPDVSYNNTIALTFLPAVQLQEVQEKNSHLCQI